MSENQEMLFIDRQEYKRVIDQRDALILAVCEAYDLLDDVRHGLPTSASHQYAQCGSIQGMIWDAVPEECRHG